MDYAVCDRAKSISANLWTPRRHFRLENFDVRSQLLIDCNAYIVKVKVWYIQHDNWCV